jgi:predicted nuclease of predicted toxin-antitoxin system
MKLLLDECLPVRLRHQLLPHDTFTVTYMGWNGIRNGRLLTLAAADRFDVLITTDHGFAHQQNPATLPLAVVILRSPSNRLHSLVPLVPDLLAALGTLSPRSLVEVG